MTAGVNAPHSPRRRRLWIGLALGAGIPLVLLLAGAVYQIVSAELDVQRHPMPGKLVDVGGRRLHLRCTGSGAPTIVFEAGLAGSALDFALVRDLLATTTRACAYDRAGYGHSEPATGPRESGRLAVGLHELLEAAGETPPYLLVGHSFGGYITRIYADRYRDQVAGLVLVDSSHEDQHRRFAELCREHSLESSCSAIRNDLLGLLATCENLAPLGVTRLALDLGLVPESAGTPYPPELAPRARAASLRTSYCRTVLAEYKAFPEASAQQVRDTGRLGDLPLVVISHGVARSDELGLPPEVPLAEADRVWQELQDNLATLSSQSTHLRVEGSGHFIQLERPDTVAAAIAALVTRLRAGAEPS